jgi:AcrR family transcriptional regulator
MPRKKPAIERPSADLRRIILDTSLALVSAEGVGALSLREVARRAGVSHGAPYHHFTDRAAIIAALAQEGYRLLESTLRTRSSEPRVVARGPVARFEACGRAYLEFAIAHTAYFRVMFRPELVNLATNAAPDTALAAMGAYGALVEIVAALQDAGIASDLDPKPLVLTAWSTAHGLAALWVDGPLGADTRTLTIGADPGLLADSVAATFGSLLRRYEAPRPSTKKKAKKPAPRR